MRQGHPWIFSESIRSQNRPGQSGELGIVYDRNNQFLGIGMFDPDSPIRLRLLHRGKPAAIDEVWWEKNYLAALHRRQTLLEHPQTNGFRLVHGENDGWPGLVLDRYGDTLVLKIYSAGWFRWLPQLWPIFQKHLPETQVVVLRLSRNLISAPSQSWKDGQLLAGALPEGRAYFLENGLQFEAEVIRGQKTGFFLDQRENRQKVESLSASRKVLNAFSFSGGFSLYAARGGAVSVTDLDLSAHALSAANRNFDLNKHLTPVTRCKHQIIQADAFEWLEKREGEKFGLIVVDPPSLARREIERSGAITAYGKLAMSAIRRLEAGGILAASSCSAHVSAEEFFGAVRKAAANSSRPFEEMMTTGHPSDHPATFPEAHYLKCIYLKIR